MTTDSGGVPFGGRTLPDPGFAGDDGAADPRLAAALAAYASDPAAEQEVLAALSAARVLVPVIAADGDMALVTLVGTDGRRALPAFSSVSTLAGWDATARPVPIDGRRAALATVAEDTDVLVVDVAGPDTYVLEGVEALEALARGELAAPAYADDALAAYVAAAAAAVPSARAAYAAPSAEADAVVWVVLAEGADAEADLAAVAAALSAPPRRLLHGLAVATGPTPPPGARQVFSR